MPSIPACSEDEQKAFEHGDSDYFDSDFIETDKAADTDQESIS